MKKVLFTAALLFAAFAVSAQESVVKQAKSAKSDPEKAASILEPALSDPTTSKDCETWKLAGDLQKSIYEQENMKAALQQEYDAERLYKSVVKLHEYYIKAAAVEKEQVAAGTLKKAKYGSKLGKEIVPTRNYLINAGSDAYNSGDYEGALTYFGVYADALNEPLLADLPEIQNDTLIYMLASYACQAANTIHNNEAVIKYAEIGKKDKEEGYRALVCLADVYGKGETPDSAKWLATIEEGVETFPQQEYFIGSLMDYYIQRGLIDEALAKIETVIATNPNPYFKYVKGVLQYEKKQYDNAIATMNEIISAGGDFQCEAYAQIGNCYFIQAQDIVEENATISMDDPKYNDNEGKIRALYEQAKPNYEKAKQAGPDKKNLWGNFLLNIYWKLNMGPEYEALEKELGY